MRVATALPPWWHAALGVVSWKGPGALHSFLGVCKSFTPEVTARCFSDLPGTDTQSRSASRGAPFFLLFTKQ